MKAEVARLSGAGGILLQMQIKWESVSMISDLALT